MTYDFIVAVVKTVAFILAYVFSRNFQTACWSSTASLSSTAGWPALNASSSKSVVSLHCEIISNVKQETLWRLHLTMTMTVYTPPLALVLVNEPMVAIWGTPFCTSAITGLKLAVQNFGQSVWNAISEQPFWVVFGSIYYWSVPGSYLWACFWV